MDAVKTFFNKPINTSNWSPDSINTDFSEKVVVVTGGNGGIGFQTVLALARHSPRRIFLTARSKSKYDDALSKIQQQVSNADNFISFVELDLSSLASVKQAAETITKSTDRLDILVNNAGIMGAPIQLTKDGYENHFGTNHMGHALLTKLLLPTLLKTAELPDSDVRIINVSSVAHMSSTSAGIDTKLVLTDMGNYGIMPRYGQSKLANVLHARALAQKYPSITTVSLHPGRVSTALLDDMYSQGRGGFFAQFQKVYDWLVTPLSMEEGAWTSLWCATIPKSELRTGSYYVPVGKLDNGTKISQSQELIDKLWQWQESEFIKLGYA